MIFDFDPEDADASEIASTFEERLRVSWLQLKADMEFRDEQEEQLAFSTYGAGYVKALSDAFGMETEGEDDE